MRGDMMQGQGQGRREPKTGREIQH
jgi:hypothetical protein